MKLFIYILCLFAGLFSSSDCEIMNSCLKELSKEKNMSSENLMVKSALFFLGKPYVGNTLEGNEEESLVVNLKEFDCFTFVETCLSMTLAAQSCTLDSDSYLDYLQKIRYRNGIIDGYTSRLHYASDWIFMNDSVGFIKDITEEIGGEQLTFQVNYMSTHPNAYKHLKLHPEDIDKIKKIESVVNGRLYYYIPKKNISVCVSQIKNGDIIFFVTNISGLDISHVGIAYREKGKLTFIHASTQEMKVIVDPQSLVDYCTNRKNNKGIVICRVQKSHKIYQ